MTIEIAQINVRKINMPLKHPFTNSLSTLNDRELLITEVLDKQGNRGFGEGVAFSAPWYTEETVETSRHMIADFLIPKLREQPLSHPDQVSGLFASVRGNNMAKAALEMAIWDLYAKQLGQPLAKILGGEKQEIDVGISLGMTNTSKELLETIAHYLKEGYKRIKLKIKPDWDVEILRQVRARFPDLPIMADANSAYTMADLSHLQQLDSLGLMMIEQPLGHDDIVDHAKLQQMMKTPICLDESIRSLEDVKKAHQLGSCQIINVKIGRVGGLTEAKKIHDYCREHGIDLWCGGMLESGIGRAHNIALTTLPQFTLPGDTAGSSRYWEQDIIQPEVTVEHGVIHVPDKPGIGYDIDQAALDAYTTDLQSFDF
ncbi:o-succinylbenzoate synthase [Lentibacillus sediminis]|uniref:o-succinylbenzoate synthase n=1 Tax=Lentibacillus sediminis TaxID=1940529 RepID=UPI000C1C03BA|nr:o-succinylbenzoate synthase [Lentibacillus sediminis]